MRRFAPAFGLPLAIALLLGGIGISPPRAAADPAPARPVPAITRALVVSVDGLRPDLLLRADAPAIHGLMRRGCFTMWAQTTASAVTLPSHVSMLTGVIPRKHGIEWNSALPLARPVYSAWPTLFELARAANLTTAMAAGKSKFSALTKPGTLTWSYVPIGTVTTDKTVTSKVIPWIDRHSPQVIFVHLPGVDTAGHADGWGSAKQMAAIAAADSCIGRILDALRRRGVLDSTVVIVTSDHGGAGLSHGPDDVRSREIPWIICGPGICPGLDLGNIENLSIRTEDTFATVCWLLGLRVKGEIDGRPVTEIRCVKSPH